jgi:hypothetical protein
MSPKKKKEMAGSLRMEPCQLAQDNQNVNVF